MHNARNLALFCLVSCAACLLFTACANQSAPPPPPATQPAAMRPANPVVWVQSLEHHQKELACLSSSLPGRDQDENAHLMAGVFEELKHILPVLHGPYEDGVFDQEMSMLDSAHNALMKTPGNVAAPEGTVQAPGSYTNEPNLLLAPIVDAALRASAHALSEIQRSNFADRTEVSEPLAQLQQSLDRLDAQGGALHRVVEADAVEAVNKTVQAMNAALKDKL